jgi:RecB family endonuclease NucS
LLWKPTWKISSTATGTVSILARDFESTTLTGKVVDNFQLGRGASIFCASMRKQGLVVIELKRGQTSDATVGQLARYMSYVKKNLAEPGQPVRGLIIARDVDQALHYAIQVVPDVSVLTYQVDFKLNLARKSE